MGMNVWGSKYHEFQYHIEPVDDVAVAAYRGSVRFEPVSTEP